MDKKFEALQTPWKIGNVEIKNKVVLAPMAGICNSSFRRICLEHNAGLVCTEMISDKGLQYENQKTLKMVEINKEEHPVSMQIFGSEPLIMADAAEKLSEKADALPVATPFFNAFQ